MSESDDIRVLGDRLALALERNYPDLIEIGTTVLQFPYRDVVRELDRTVACLRRLSVLNRWSRDRLPSATGRQSVAVLLPYNIVAHGIFVTAAIAAGGNRVAVRFSSRVRPLAELSRTMLVDALGERVSVSFQSGRDFVNTVRSDTGLYPVFLAYGGERLGELLIDAPRGQRTIFEGPGKDPLIALAGANPLEVAETLRLSKFSRSGQECISTERVVVEDSIYDDVVETLLELCRDVNVGSPEDPDTVVAPIENPALPKRISRQLDESISMGARLMEGGNVKGSRVDPTLVVDVPSTSSLWQDETFGPVIAVRRAEDPVEAARIATEGRYGLHAIVFGDNASKMAASISGSSQSRFVEERKFGVVGTATVGRAWFEDPDDDFKPFGGWGISGWVVEKDGRLRQGPRLLINEVTEAT